MKKLFALLVVLVSVSLAWAGEIRLTEEKFMTWVQVQHIEGFEADAESLENYMDQEFTIDFMSTAAPTHLSIKVSGAGEMAGFRADAAELSEMEESVVGSAKALYCVMKAMPNVSLMFVDVPGIDGELRLLTSPKKSMDEMKAILAGLDLKALN
jgi:hypothetical protein